MESGLKRPCCSFHTGQVVPIVIRCLHGDRGWVSSVPWEVCAQVRRDVMARLAGGGCWGCTRSMG